MVKMMSTNMKKRARRTWLGLDIKPRQGHWCTQLEKEKWRKGAKTNLSRRHRPTQPMHHHNEEWRPWRRFEQCVFVFEIVKIGAKNKHQPRTKSRKKVTCTLNSKPWIGIGTNWSGSGSGVHLGTGPKSGSTTMGWPWRPGKLFERNCLKLCYHYKPWSRGASNL